MQINRKCGRACVNYHLSAIKPLRSFGPTQRGPTLVCTGAHKGRSVQLRGTEFESEQLEHLPYMDLSPSGA